MKYYYFAASLPALSLGEPPPWNLDAFLAEAERQLEPEDLKELTRLLNRQREAVRLTCSGDWLDTDTQLRNSVAVARAARRNIDPAPYLRPHAGYSVAVEDAVTDAYSRAHPMERDLSLDRFRWNRLNEMMQPDPFGLAGVMAYALKLSLVERWAGLTDDAGRERLEKMLAALVHPAPSGTDTPSIKGET